VNDPCDLEDEPTRTDNAGIFNIYQADSSAVLDGVTITGGRQQNPADGRLGGGGLAIGESSATIMNCTFRGNWAESIGGAVFIRSGHPTLSNCTFTKNYAGSGGAIAGGGRSTIITNCTFIGNAARAGGALAECHGIISDCVFRGNSADRGGGAWTGCNGLITKCLFSCNSASEHGGAVSAGYCDSPTLANCVFANNVAAGLGGGLFICYDTNATLINCSFSANSATNGNALASYSWRPEHPPNNLQMTNCILWDGGNEIWSNGRSTIKISYSNLRGGRAGVHDPCDGLIWGEGNIDAEPLFAHPNNDDYHLKSQAGRWTSASSVEPEAKEGRWTKDDVTSPCIDAGNMSSPIGNEPFPRWILRTLRLWHFIGWRRQERTDERKDKSERLVGDFGDCDAGPYVRR